MGKLIIKICTNVFFVLFCLSTYSQNEFDYQWYLSGFVRDGKLLYDDKTHTALYIDLLSTIKKTKPIDYSHLKPEPGESITVIRASTSWYDRLFFKKEAKIKYTTDLLKKRFLVEDNTLQLDWILKDETKEINGYLCKKATVHLRGRDWEVWYTPEIPMYYGPWKFYGLPGLIVAAYESTGEYWFQLTKIHTNPELNFPTVVEKEYKQVDLKEYSLLEEDVMSGKPLSALGVKVDEDYKRNGMEIIYEWEEGANK